MVEAGEEPDHAAQREFIEETMNGEQLEPNDFEAVTKRVAEMFATGKMVLQINWQCHSILIILLILNKYFVKRSIKDMLMIHAILIMRGWKRQQ